MARIDYIEKAISIAMATGGDFAEVFIEDKDTSSISLINGKIENAISGRVAGIGVRVYQGTNGIYAFASGSGEKVAIEAANLAAAALKASDLRAPVKISESVCKNVHPVRIVPFGVQNERKVALIKRAHRVISEFSAEVAQTTIAYADVDQRVTIANSEGLFTQDRRIRTRLVMQAIAANQYGNQVGMEGPGALKGFEFYDEIDVDALAQNAARVAVTMLHAKKCPGGMMPVAIENGFGGVIFHEACGHALEATAVAKGNSVFTGMLGQKIASDCVTAVDDGTMPEEWGSINIDDEGRPSQRLVLIENGILKNYMIDRLNGRRMNSEPTGNARCQSYKYNTTSRMTNTYIAPGNHSDEEIIASMPDGLYAKKMGGGSVNVVTGEFNFAVLEGYLVKNGKIEEPVRGATLIGKGEDVLKKIDMVGKNLKLGQGMCGSVSGAIPTNVGQPLIRVSELTVGGGE